MVLNDQVEQHCSLLFDAGIEVSAFPGLIDLADAAVEGRIFLDTEQFACSEFFLQAVNGRHGVLVCGVEAFRSCRVSYLETLVIVCIQRIKSISIVPNHIEEVGRLVGSEKQLLAEYILQQPDSFLQVFVFLFGDGVAVNGIALKHILLDNVCCPDSKSCGTDGVYPVSNRDYHI